MTRISNTFRIMLCLLSTILISLSLGATTTQEYKLCTAIRGNGYKLPVTLAALSKTSEEFGVSDLVLGSSSGSIGAFLHEQILSNSEIRSCKGRPCDAAELGRRVSTAIKSMLGYTEYLKTKTRAGRIVKKLAKKMEDGEKLSSKDLLTIASSSKLRQFFNTKAIFPSIQTLLPQNWKTLFERVIGSAGSANFGGVDNFEIALRDGLIDLEFALKLVGQAGDFYAGLGTDLRSQWRSFYDKCTPQAKGQIWEDIARTTLPDASSCQNHLFSMLDQFMQKAYPKVRVKHNVAGKTKYTWRTNFEPLSLKRTVGETTPTLMTVSFFKDDDVYQKFRQDKKDYDRFRQVDLSAREWEDRFRVAYFGNENILKAIELNSSKFQDLKTQRFLAAGAETWKEALLRSIGEPGLAHAKSYVTPLGDKGVTAGGWVDNHGTLALKNAGCEKIIYLTRRGTDSNYAQKVASQFGLSPEFMKALFGHGPGESFGESLRHADGIYCTDWDKFKGLMNPIADMARHGFESPMVTRDPWLIEQSSPHINLLGAYDIPGCRPPGAASL